MPGAIKTVEVAAFGDILRDAERDFCPEKDFQRRRNAFEKKVVGFQGTSRLTDSELLLKIIVC